MRSGDSSRTRRGPGRRQRLAALLAGLLGSFLVLAGSAPATLIGPPVNQDFSKDPNYTTLFCLTFFGNCAFLSATPADERVEIGFVDAYIDPGSAKPDRSQLLIGQSAAGGQTTVVDEWSLGTLDPGLNRRDVTRVSPPPILQPGEHVGLGIGADLATEIVVGALREGLTLATDNYLGPGDYQLVPVLDRDVAVRVSRDYGAVLGGKDKQKVNKLKAVVTGKGPPDRVNPSADFDVTFTGIANISGSSKGGAYLSAKGKKYKLKKKTIGLAPGEEGTTRLKFKNNKKVVKRIKKALKKSKKARKKAKLVVKVKVSGPDGSGTAKKKIKLKP